MSRAAFMAGVQHAAAMFREAEVIRSDSKASPAAIELEHLDGKPQRNFASDHLRALLIQPGMLEGFAAALSDYLGTDVATTADFYADLTEAEIFEPPDA